MNVSPGNIECDLEQHHRDAMLDLILVWGSLDGAIKTLLSDLKGYNLQEGADRFEKMSASKAIGEIRDVYRNKYGHMQEGQSIASNWRKIKKKYERHSKARNTIAHSHCVGFLKDHPNYIIFLPFKRHADDLMACDCVPMEQMHVAQTWGEKLKEGVMRIPVLRE